MARTHQPGKVESIEFMPSETGGMKSHTLTKYKRSGQGGGPAFDVERTAVEHPTMEHAHAHLEKHLGHVFGAGADNTGDRMTADEQENE